MQSNVICVHPARRDGGTVARRLREAGHKVWCVPELVSRVVSPEFDRPDAVLLEQSVAENLVELARSLWPHAAVVRFQDGEHDDRVLERVEAALTSGRG